MVGNEYIVGLVGNEYIAGLLGIEYIAGLIGNPLIALYDRQSLHCLTWNAIFTLLHMKGNLL